MGDQYSEVAVKLGQYISPALDRGITDEDYPLFDLLLDFAKDKIFAQGYPFGNRPDELPLQYQSSYTNNGITRVWESSDVAQSLLNEVVPRVGVIG